MSGSSRTRCGVRRSLRLLHIDRNVLDRLSCCRYPLRPHGVKVVAEGVNAEGAKESLSYTTEYDGRDVPVTGSRQMDTVSANRVDINTAERTYKKDAKVVATREYH